MGFNCFWAVHLGCLDVAIWISFEFGLGCDCLYEFSLVIRGFYML